VPWNGWPEYDVSKNRGEGLVWAASFVGHLIECGLLDHDLVRSHLIKPLIAHDYASTDGVGRSFRALAIYQLFAAARDTLLQGLLEPEDVGACFKTLDKISPGISSRVVWPGGAELNVRSPIYPSDSLRSLFANLLQGTSRVPCRVAEAKGRTEGCRADSGT